MVRCHAWMIGAVAGLHALGAFALGQDARLPATIPLPGPPPGAQDARISATIPPPGSPPLLRLSREDAQRIALANNTGLTLARLGVQEKSISVDAARRDYFPKLLGNDLYFHFNANLGVVNTVQTGRLGILPVGTHTVAVTAFNQDSNLASITVAQPITKLIAVNAAVQLARADAQIAQAQLDKGTSDLLSGVAQAYHGMYGAERIAAALDIQVQVARRLAQINSNPEIRVALIEAQQALLQV